MLLPSFKIGRTYATIRKFGRDIMANKNDFSWLWLLAIGGGLWLLSKTNAPTSADVANGTTAAAASLEQGKYTDPITIDREVGHPILWNPKPPYDGGPDGIRDFNPEPTGAADIRFLGPPVSIDPYTTDKTW